MVSLEEILKKMQSSKLSPNDCQKFILKIEQKIKNDLNSLFEGLGGAQIHDILSKIGYMKNVINMVIESKGSLDYQGALKSAATQLEEILALYKKSGVSTVIS
jgi:hypothetical protein